LRASAGTLAVIGGLRARTCPEESDLPTTAYLLEGERCARDCAFCPQARSSGPRDDLLSRVNWPEVRDASFWDGASRAAADGQFRRLCLQLTVSPGIMARAERQVRRARESCPGLPICVSAGVRGLGEIEEVLSWGVERVTLALDAAAPGIHREVKGSSPERKLALLGEASGRFPGRIGTHLIAGLGETEKEMALAFQDMADMGVTVALFAFTPVPGTKLAAAHPPGLRSYRRLQAARHLISGHFTRAEDMAFDSQGGIASYGLTWDEVAARLAGGEAFRTSGCPDCNRPYYNERPSGPLYNYPRRLTPEEAREAVEEARPGIPTSRRGRSDRAGRPDLTARPAWRLIVEARPRSGPWNMAVDEAIMLAYQAGEVAPTLRFYRWAPPTVTLGYFQDAATEVDREACLREGIGLVRRLTGGRAVLHDKEVTYSVVVSSGLLPGSVVETYRKLAGGLVTGFKDLGLDAALAPEKATPGGPGSPYGACFEVPSSYEIVARGRKVVGSAQVRRKDVILQHGAILLELDAGLLGRVLGLGEEAGARIAGKAAGLAELLNGRVPGYEEVCGAVARGLEAVLGVVLRPGRLTEGETLTARRLVRDRYGRDAWNLRRPATGESDEENEREDY